VKKTPQKRADVIVNSMIRPRLEESMGSNLVIDFTGWSIDDALLDEIANQMPGFKISFQDHKLSITPVSFTSCCMEEIQKGQFPVRISIEEYHPKSIEITKVELEKFGYEVQINQGQMELKPSKKLVRVEALCRESEGNQPVIRDRYASLQNMEAHAALIQKTFERNGFEVKMVKKKNLISTNVVGEAVTRTDEHRLCITATKPDGTSASILLICREDTPARK